MAELTEATIATQLKRADIILIHGDSAGDWIIHQATASYWNHVALVYVVSDGSREADEPAQGYDHTFVLEAEAPQGVDIHKIDKYLFNLDQDMAILRLPQEAAPPARRNDYLRRVRGFALDEIDATYAYGALVGIARRLMPGLNLLLGLLVPSQRRGVARAVNQWTCSGVVQYAYYRACLGVDPGKDAAWDSFFDDAADRARVVVDPELRGDVAGGLGLGAVEDRLKLATPAQFALAARRGDLVVVGERIGRAWSPSLTRK